MLTFLPQLPSAFHFGPFCIALPRTDRGLSNCPMHVPFHQVETGKMDTPWTVCRLFVRYEPGVTHLSRWCAWCHNSLSKTLHAIVSLYFGPFRSLQRPFGPFRSVSSVSEQRPCRWRQEIRSPPSFDRRLQQQGMHIFERIDSSPKISNLVVVQKPKKSAFPILRLCLVLTMVNKLSHIPVNYIPVYLRLKNWVYYFSG
jgi:hypothetical protein